MNVQFVVSNDGGKTIVKCSENMQECLDYCKLQNVGGGNYVVIVAPISDEVDLNTCKPGDILVSKQGTKLTYVGKAPEGSYYDHFVQYPDGSEGSRTNDGFVFKNPSRRLELDGDIVEILPC